MGSIAGQVQLERAVNTYAQSDNRRLCSITVRPTGAQLVECRATNELQQTHGTALLASSVALLRIMEASELSSPTLRGCVRDPRWCYRWTGVVAPGYRDRSKSRGSRSGPMDHDGCRTNCWQLGQICTHGKHSDLTARTCRCTNESCNIGLRGVDHNQSCDNVVSFAHFDLRHTIEHIPSFPTHKGLIEVRQPFEPIPV